MDTPVEVFIQRNGFTYLARLVPVHGAATSVWHLMVGDYYRGRFRSADGVWVLDTNTPMETSADDLARQLPR